MSITQNINGLNKGILKYGPYFFILNNLKIHN